MSIFGKVLQFGIRVSSVVTNALVLCLLLAALLKAMNSLEGSAVDYAITVIADMVVGESI